VNGVDDIGPAARIWNTSDVIVDAILGTGLRSEVRSPYKEAVEAMNDAPALKVAVDIPSGLDADTGRILGVAVEADLTATYGFMKLGMAVHPGVDICGHVVTVDISIPGRVILEKPPRARLYRESHAREDLPGRGDPTAHKGTFGHLLVVGGSPGKTGAIAMTARAAGKIGAGLVTAAVPASLNPIFEMKLTEEMTEPLPEAVPGILGPESADRVLSLAKGKRCMVLGPGLSTGDGISRFLARILEEYEGWVVLDADALNALAENVEVLKRDRGNVVLTPHPGEMARLAGCSTRDVQDDRVGMAGRMAEAYGAAVILKGARTVIAFPDGSSVINTSGNPWMASGGQGDVLSGILGGFLVQGVPAERALPLGVFLHGFAADRIVEAIGPAPVQATAVIEALPALLGRLAQDEEPEEDECCDSHHD
jgi:ADP-dependent NAD(P)H-hydrate dehydratase / NAD(P)H-hydrate epimerase